MNGNEFPRIMQINQKVMDANETVIQGYWLGKDGKNVRAAEKAKTNNPDTPFTVIGLDSAKQRMILWVNDGRFAEDSPGISFNAIGEYLTQLGCSDVLSIDGGGSSTMVLPDENGVLQVMNHPSDNKKFDHKGARKVQNCFFLIPADH